MSPQLNLDPNTPRASQYHQAIYKGRLEGQPGEYSRVLVLLFQGEGRGGGGKEGRSFYLLLFDEYNFSLKLFLFFLFVLLLFTIQKVLNTLLINTAHREVSFMYIAFHAVSVDFFTLQCC